MKKEIKAEYLSPSVMRISGLSGSMGEQLVTAKSCELVPEMNSLLPGSDVWTLEGVACTNESDGVVIVNLTYKYKQAKDPVLEKLEEIRCGLIDVETAIEKIANPKPDLRTAMDIVNPYISKEYADVLIRAVDKMEEYMKAFPALIDNEPRFFFQIDEAIKMTAVARS
jgi:hypothetical protein